MKILVFFKNIYFFSILNSLKYNKYINLRNRNHTIYAFKLNKNITRFSIEVFPAKFNIHIFARIASPCCSLIKRRGKSHCLHRRLSSKRYVIICVTFRNVYLHVIVILLIRLFTIYLRVKETCLVLKAPVYNRQ